MRFRLRGSRFRVSRYRYGFKRFGVSDTGTWFRVCGTGFWWLGVSGSGLRGSWLWRFGVGGSRYGVRGTGFWRLGISGTLFAVHGFGQGFSRFGVVELGDSGSGLRGT